MPNATVRASARTLSKPKPGSALSPDKVEVLTLWSEFVRTRPAAEVDAMKADVASGALHPMEAKKRLARTITAGFHGEAAAESAGENWARMFQQKATSEDLEEVHIAFGDVEGPADILQIRLPKLLVQLGLAASNAEANRKIVEKAVKLDGEVAANALLPIDSLPAKFVVRLGKRAKVAIIGGVGEGV